MANDTETEMDENNAPTSIVHRPTEDDDDAMERIADELGAESSDPEAILDQIVALKGIAIEGDKDTTGVFLVDVLAHLRDVGGKLSERVSVSHNVVNRLGAILGIDRWGHDGEELIARAQALSMFPTLCRREMKRIGVPSTPYGRGVWDVLVSIMKQAGFPVANEEALGAPEKQDGSGDARSISGMIARERGRKSYKAIDVAEIRRHALSMADKVIGLFGGGESDGGSPGERLDDLIGLAEAVRRL